MAWGRERGRVMVSCMLSHTSLLFEKITHLQVRPVGTCPLCRIGSGGGDGGGASGGFLPR